MPGTPWLARVKQTALLWTDRFVEVFASGTFLAAILAAPLISAYQYFWGSAPRGCTALQSAVGEFEALAYYVHLVPLSVLLVIAGFVFFRGSDVRAKRVFTLFIGAFSLWLLGNLITWTANGEAAVYAVRLTLWFVEVAFFALGAYFAAALLFGGKVPALLRLLLPLLLIAPLLALAKWSAAASPLLALCEPFGKTFLAVYPLYVEISILGLIAYFWARVPFSPFPPKPLYAIIASLFMFLGTFTIGSFVVWLTGHYEFLLYGLLALPVFIIVLVYSVTNLELFRVQSFGIQVLIYLVMLLVSSQFLFMDSTTDRLLVGITLVFTAVFGYLFQQSALREVGERHKVEVLAADLAEVNDRQEKLMHFVGHEVKGFLTKDQGAFAALAEGDAGALPGSAKSFAERALSGAREGVRSITEILTASNLKQGTTALKSESFDLKKVIAGAVEKAEPLARQKGLTLSFVVPDLVSEYPLQGDADKLGDHVFRNLIENAINYTPSGFVQVSLKKENNAYVCRVKDTGVGITEEDKKLLFTEGGHGKDSQKINVHSTGFGLFIAKTIVEAHKGTIRAESEGQGKGSTFVVAFPAPSR